MPTQRMPRIIFKAKPQEQKPAEPPREDVRLVRIRALREEIEQGAQLIARLEQQARESPVQATVAEMTARVQAREQEYQHAVEEARNKHEAARRLREQADVARDTIRRLKEQLESDVALATRYEQESQYEQTQAAAFMRRVHEELEGRDLRAAQKELHRATHRVTKQAREEQVRQERRAKKLAELELLVKLSQERETPSPEPPPDQAA